MPPLGNPTKPAGLLGGLASNPNVSAFAKGKAMESNATIGLQKSQKDQESAVSQMQEDSQQRQRQSQNFASRAGNESQERMRANELGDRRSAFEVGMGFDYASMMKKRQLDFKQTLLNGLSRSF